MRKILEFLRKDYEDVVWNRLFILVVIGISFSVASMIYRDGVSAWDDTVYLEELENLRSFQVNKDFERLQAIIDLSIEFHFDPTIVMIVDHHSRLNVDRSKPAWSIIKSHEMMTHITLSLIDIESNGRTFAKSNKKAYGLTQLLLPTARDYEPEVTVNDLYDQETNIRIFFMHFERLLEKYNGNVTKVLDAWNRGEGTVDKLLAQNINPANGYSADIYKVAVENNRFRIGRVY